MRHSAHHSLRYAVAVTQRIGRSSSGTHTNHSEVLCSLRNGAGRASDVLYQLQPHPNWELRATANLTTTGALHPTRSLHNAYLAGLGGLTELQEAVAYARLNVRKEQLKVKCLERVLGNSRNLTSNEYDELLASVDAHTAAFIRTVTTISEPFTIEKGEQKLEKTEQKLENLKAELKAEREMAEREKAEQKLENLKAEREKAERYIDEVICGAKRAILALPDQVDNFADALEKKGIVTAGDAFKAGSTVIDAIAVECGLDRDTMCITLLNPYLMLLEFPVSLFVTRRIFAHKDVSTLPIVDLTLRAWSIQNERIQKETAPATPTEKELAEPIRMMFLGLSKHLLAFEKMEVRQMLCNATAMRPRPMTCDHVHLLGLDLIGETTQVAVDCLARGAFPKEDRPVRCIVSTPRSGKTRALDEIALIGSRLNTPMISGQPLVVRNLVVNMTYNSHTPLKEVIESDPHQFYRCFWGRFLRGCAHPLLPNLFNELVDWDNGTSCTHHDVRRIIEEVYGVTALTDLVVTVDEFSKVLDLHADVGKDKGEGFKDAYSSFTSWLADGARFAFSGFHTDIMTAFASRSGRRINNHVLPTLPLADLHKHKTAACIINAVAASMGQAFPLADYEASKSSVGLMGYALEACRHLAPVHTWFETPWKITLKKECSEQKELLFDCLKHTLCGQALPDASEKAGLAIRGGDGTLSIHPYALYTLLNAMHVNAMHGKAEPSHSFEVATLDMWKRFCAAVNAYHTAITSLAILKTVPAETGTPSPEGTSQKNVTLEDLSTTVHGGSGADGGIGEVTEEANTILIQKKVDAIRMTKGPMLETLLRHVLHLRALAKTEDEALCRLNWVERFPTLVDKCASTDEITFPSPNEMVRRIEEIKALVASVKEDQHVVLNAREQHNVADVSVLQRRHDELRIDVYETKHFDMPIPKNEKRNKYLGALVGLLHLRQQNALPGKVRIQFHFVAVTNLYSKQPALGPLEAKCSSLPSEYTSLFNHPLETFSIDGIVKLLEKEGVTVEDHRTYQTQNDLEELLTRPLLLLLPDGGKLFSMPKTV